MDDGKMPDVDPHAMLSTLATGMVQLHEMFRAAIDAGFSEQQAMTIVVETLRASTGGTS